MDGLDLPEIYRRQANQNHIASDGQKFEVEPSKAKTWLVFGRNEHGDPIEKALKRLVSSPKAQVRWRNPEENPYIFRLEDRNTVTSHYHDVAMAMGQA